MRIGQKRRQMRRPDPRVAAGVLALGGFMVVAGLVARRRTDALDLATTRFVQRVLPEQLDGVMAVASWPGFPPQSRVLPPAITCAWWISGRRRAAAFQGMAWGGAFLSTVTKFFVRRPRPSPAEVRVVTARLDGTSFPSGHVLAYTAFYGFLVRLIGFHVRPVRLRRLLQAALLTLLGLVGLSRIQRGHHWASDVLASYLLGVAYVAWLACLSDRFGESHREAKHVGV